MDYTNDDDVVELDEKALHVQQLFEERDDQYIEATQRIVDAIGPTVLEALYHVFAVPPDDVHWLDFQSTEHLLIIICSITYNPSVYTPVFIRDTVTAVPRVDFMIDQTVRIGIPYEVVSKTTEEIVDFMTALVNSHKEGGPTLIEHTDVQESKAQTTENEGGEQPQQALDGDVGVFTSDSLTLEQKHQLLLFQHQTKGKIH